MTKSDKIITNRGIIKAGEFQEMPANSGVSVYEVIRITDGIPLFVEDHFERLVESARILGIPFGMDYPVFRRKMAELVQINQKPAGNIRFVYTSEDNCTNWLFSFIPHSYPSDTDYSEGVKVGLLMAERETPNAKVIQQSVRDRANQMIADQHLYEVLLVDREGKITEGSRSNVFFVKGDVFYTAPAALVLAGITRLKVLECLKKLNFRMIEDAVAATEINRFDAAFLTGTSPKILPVRSVGTQNFLPGLACVRQLMSAYDKLIEQYADQERYRLK